MTSLETSPSHRTFWNGIQASPPIEVKMTQKCWDVTGTFKSFLDDPPCSGTLTGRIDGNQLSGSWSGCVLDHSTSGKFYLAMAPGNMTWTGKMIPTWVLQENYCPDCPPNWAGKRVG